MKTSFKVEGLREIEKALLELPQATRKPTMRRVATKALAPFEEAAKANAPKLTGDLEASITTGTRLNKRQRRLSRRLGKSAVEVHTGTANQAGVPQEFGTFKESAQPFMRPAWDATQGEVLDGVKTLSWEEIEKTAKRVARKALRAASKG